MGVEKAAAAPTEQKKGKVPGLLKRMGQVPLLAKGQYLGPGLPGTPVACVCCDLVRELFDFFPPLTYSSFTQT